MATDTERDVSPFWWVPRLLALPLVLVGFLIADYSAARNVATGAAIGMVFGALYWILRGPRAPRPPKGRRAKPVARAAPASTIR